jgi:hypothetical protein
MIFFDRISSPEAVADKLESLVQCLLTDVSLTNGHLTDYQLIDL